MKKRPSQQLWARIVYALPLLAFGVFMAATRVEAGELVDQYCYYADEKYSVGSCLDMDCCFWCWDDNQRCYLNGPGGPGVWSACGDGC